MPPKTRLFLKSGIKPVSHPRVQQELEAMGCSIIALTSKQTNLLSSLTVSDSLSNNVMRVEHEVLSPLGGNGRLREAFNCSRFVNMNKTAENPTPFGLAENLIANTLDQTVRDAVASLKAKQGASLNMNKLDVDNLHIFVSVLSAKKANGKHTSTLQDWHQDCKPNMIAQMKKNQNLGMTACI